LQSYGFEYDYYSQYVVNPERILKNGEITNYHLNEANLMNMIKTQQVKINFNEKFYDHSPLLIIPESSFKIQSLLRIMLVEAHSASKKLRLEIKRKRTKFLECFYGGVL